MDEKKSYGQIFQSKWKGVNFINIFARVFRTKRRFGSFFLDTSSTNVAAKMTFVWKIRTFNVDEIDGRMPNKDPTERKKMFEKNEGAIYFYKWPKWSRDLHLHFWTEMNPRVQNTKSLLLIYWNKMLSTKRIVCKLYLQTRALTEF